MNDSRMNVAYSFSWTLRDGGIAEARTTVEQLRLHALEMGAESVSDVIELTSDVAKAVQPDSHHVIMFTAIIPNVTMPPFKVQQYGLALREKSPEEISLTWSGIVRVSSFREIGGLMVAAAKLGINVGTSFAGMVMEFKRNAVGEVEVEQHYAYEGMEMDDF
jgi:hypothetical protein